MRHKTFDWLEKAQEEIHTKTKDMTTEEFVAYWKQRADELQKEKYRLVAQREAAQRKAS